MVDAFSMTPKKQLLERRYGAHMMRSLECTDWLFSGLEYARLRGRIYKALYCQ
jgi:hypothetical protein